MNDLIHELVKSALCIHKFHICGFNHGSKKFFLIPESFKKQNLNLPQAINYLQSIYIVFTTIYMAFTFALGIRSNLEMI